ncbi:MAG: class II aldolase/adducin family protein [Solirubrobacterales bacterium]|nr:class II aldolase/adducin family protein [Solirubrobacterales bacterium]
MALMLEAERERVAAAGRRLAAEGLVLGSAGNVSARVGEQVAISATGTELGDLASDRVIVVDLDGRPVAGGLPPSSELGLHLGIYKRYRAGGVVHAHGPYGTALACVLDELPVIHYEMLALGGAVRVARHATFGTEELAAATLNALQDRSAALMANHGTIAYGLDLDAAVERTVLLEWLCALYWRAAAIAVPRELDEAEQRALARAFASRPPTLGRRNEL